MQSIGFYFPIVMDWSGHEVSSGTRRHHGIASLFSVLLSIIAC